MPSTWPTTSGTSGIASAAPKRVRRGLEEHYSLADALAVATYLNIFIRHCRTVRIANLAQMVNVIAPIFTSPQGLYRQTIYHPLRLYAEHMQRSRAGCACRLRDLQPVAGARDFAVAAPGGRSWPL